MRALSPASHPARLTRFAREMRAQPTDSEARLWVALRRGQLLGAEFRRQVPLGKFVVDFLAREERVVVEVDGPYHERRLRADERRDRKLRRLGYRVVRVSAEEVTRELPRVLERIGAALREGGR